MINALASSSHPLYLVNNSLILSIQVAGVFSVK